MNATKKLTTSRSRPSLSNPRSTNDIVRAFSRANPTPLRSATNRVPTGYTINHIIMCKDTIRDEPTSVGFAHEKAQTMSFVERGFERLGLDRLAVGFFVAFIQG